jgi:hypothetical protein
LTPGPLNVAWMDTKTPIQTACASLRGRVTVNEYLFQEYRFATVQYERQAAG